MIVPHYGGSTGHPTAPRSMRSPLSTITTRDHTSLVTASLAAAHLTTFYGTSETGVSAEAPMPTITAGGGKGGGHIGLVNAFLVQYNSAGGHPSQHQDLRAPLHTVVSRDRFGLVMVHGVPHRIVDIGLRMLQPHELAAAMGFPEDYDLSPAETKTEKVALIGNAVCCEVAEAIVVRNALTPGGQLQFWRAG